MQFSEAYERYRRDINVVALAQRVPGLDVDDVVSEMLVCLWRASQTFRSGKGTFGSYWWSLWLNRRTDLAKAYYRRKRALLIPTDDVDPGAVLNETFPEAPRGSGVTERLIWDLLALGEPVQDVIRACRISRRRYYDIIHGWRTDEIRRELMD